MKINQLKWGTVLSYVSLILGTIVSLIYTPIMLTQLGSDEYAVYNLALPIVAYLNLLSFGLGSAYTRYYSRYKTNNNQAGMAKLNGMFLSTYLVLGLVVLCLGLIIAKNAQLVLGHKLNAEQIALASRLMVILTISAALSFPISVFESHVMINEAYLFQKLVAIGKTVLNPLIMIPLLLMGYRSVTLVTMTLIFTILSGILNITYCVKKLHMPINMNSFDFPLMKEMLGFTVYVFIGIIADQINWSIDRLLLGWIHGTSQVTIYVQASQLNIYYLSLATAFSGILTPRVHRMVSENRPNSELSELFTKVGRLQFIIMSMVLLGFVAVGCPFIVQWSGGDASKFTVSYYITLILFASTLIPSIQGIGIEIQRAKNMHMFRSLVYLGVAIGNIFLSIPLAIKLNGFGAAIGTFTSVLIGNVILMNWYYHKRIGLDIPGFWKSICKMLPSLIIPTIVAVLIAIYNPYHSYLGVLIGGCIFVIVFIPCMWFFGMNSYEKDLVIAPLKRIFKRKESLTKS